ncbi:hypothetical protein [Rickettsia endosymbiont of Culicoides newsteadi]|uniref:hypothetical protein n=1 Tax=Rickettsia endosymbiont of Culicoides newsteadi TaxID=1961830 RepID=UPI000B9AD2EF|nr:hypothetical protein [Rickettsia endosymbiont of Culicoides newsteadi]OZG31693.1 transposase [Rickettsia endosymbiont of Culicoides newsteadi]
MEYNTIGIDLAKNIFHLHAVDKYGARSVFTARVLRTKKLDKIEEGNKSRFTDWMFKLQERRGYNTSVVAVANKLARVVFTVLRNDQSYSEIKVCY